MKVLLMTFCFILTLNGFTQQKFSFVFIPDIHLQNEQSSITEFDSLISEVNQLNPDFLITGGDMIFEDINSGLKKPRICFNY